MKYQKCLSSEQRTELESEVTNDEIKRAVWDYRQILDGPFILNEVLQWCKVKKKQSLIFKVDFEKAYDSVRWDFLDDVLRWTWTLESSGDFSVASARKFIDDKSILVVDYKTRWIKYVPIKVNVHAWKVKSNCCQLGFNISPSRVIYMLFFHVVLFVIRGTETFSPFALLCCMVQQVVSPLSLLVDVIIWSIESYDGWLDMGCGYLRLPYKYKMMLEGVVSRNVVTNLGSYRNKTIFG
ncbi:hypothetical protein Tco_0816778 [Tanacetum coccineum]